MPHRDLLHFLKAAPLLANNVTRYPPPGLHEFSLGVATNGSVWGPQHWEHPLFLGGFTMHQGTFLKVQMIYQTRFLVCNLKVQLY